MFYLFNQNSKVNKTKQKHLFFILFLEDCFFSREQKLKWKFKLKSKQKNINKINNFNTKKWIWTPWLRLHSSAANECSLSRESRLFVDLDLNANVCTFLASLLLISWSWSRIQWFQLVSRFSCLALDLDLESNVTSITSL